MKDFDWQLRKTGTAFMAGQVVDTSLVPVPRRRDIDSGKAVVKFGESAKEIWPDGPNRAAQKDTSTRWMLEVGGKFRHLRETRIGAFKTLCAGRF